jgi:hypothetical protein
MCFRRVCGQSVGKFEICIVIVVEVSSAACNSKKVAKIVASFNKIQSVSKAKIGADQ